jgi:hypothetical protein
MAHNVPFMIQNLLKKGATSASSLFEVDLNVAEPIRRVNTRSEWVKYLESNKIWRIL